MIIKIEKITDYHGNDRLDGRYPSRIGMYGRIIPTTVKEGNRLVIQYLSWPDLLPYRGVFTTSTIRNVQKDISVFQIKTRNSIYTLRIIQEE